MITKCTIAKGKLDCSGYGRIKVKGKAYQAHRFAWLQSHGEIPPGKQIDHLCRNRACINVSHLEIVTAKENILRGIGIAAQNAKKLHCKRGHKFTDANTFKDERGSRFCRQCRNDRNKIYRSSK